MNRIFSALLIFFLIGCIAETFYTDAVNVYADSRAVKRRFTVKQRLESGRIALVIGNSAYKSAPLINPVNDAEDMAAALKLLGFKVLFSKNQGREAMFNSIREFGSALHGGNVALFYYSGHGIQANGSNFMIPVDADIRYEDEVAAQAINANLVLGKMESAGTPVNIMVLDACRNNPFEKSWRSQQTGLARMDAPGGTKIIYSAKPGTLALDGKGRNSPFTEYLKIGIQKSGNDLEDVIRFVAKKVETKTKGMQEAWAEGILKEKFYFAVSTEPPPHPCTEGADFCEDFTDNAYEGAYDKTRWFGEGDLLGFIQKNGIMSVSQNINGKADTRLCPQQYRNVRLQQPTFIETRIKLDNRANHGDAMLLINLHKDYDTADRKTWTTMCRLTPGGKAYCHFGENARGWKEKWKSDYYPAAPGTWQVFRVEFDPSDVSFRYYLNGKSIDNGKVYDPDSLPHKNDLLFRPSVGVANWGYQRFESLNASIDYVKLGSSGNRSDAGPPVSHEGGSHMSLYDNFEAASATGKLDYRKWDFLGDRDNFITENGMVKIIQQGRTEAFTMLKPRLYHGVEKNSPVEIEIKARLDGKHHAGNLILVVDMHNGYDANPRKRWTATLRLSQYGYAYAKFGRNHPDTEFKELYRSDKKEKITVDFDRWYTLRLYTDPATMTFRYYLDGRFIGEYTCEETRRQLTGRRVYQAQFGVANRGNNRNDRIVGYIDDVRVGEGK